MRLFRASVIIGLLISISIYFIYNNNILSLKSIDKNAHMVQNKQAKVKDKEIPSKRLDDSAYEGDLFQWIGESDKKLKEQLGEPVRKDLSAYGYKWWVYNDFDDYYIQFGILDNKIVTIFATGDQLSTEPVQIGQSYDEINDQITFEKEVDYHEGVSAFQFKLTDDDVLERPLVKVSNNLYMQLYFDRFTETLSSVRLLNGETLLRHQPYEVEYRGSLPDNPILDDDEWEKVEKGMEQQIFDITNIVRDHHEQKTLDWEESVSDVAFKHSKDMEQNNYFSHYNPDGDGLKERLDESSVSYFSAGENIAAMYPDAPAAMEGWLNSEGHREALLNNEYTHIGVGVYRKYYTQNFLEKP